MIFAPIKTERLRLRCVTAQDAAATAALMTQSVSDWLASWPQPFTLEMARQRIEIAGEAARRKAALTYAITLKDGGKFIGWMGLARCETNPRRAALSYWLGADYHGQGFAREALAGLLQNGFSVLELDVIEGGAQLENTGSFAVMRACGMAEVGQRMVHAPSRGRDEPCLFYEIHRPTAVA